jgi:hypothetical protein
VNDPNKPRTLADAWASYAAEVIPATAPVVQRVETRRGFYAGAKALMRVVLNVTSDGPDMTDEDLVKMDALESEIEAFMAEVGTAAERAKAIGRSGN